MRLWSAKRSSASPSTDVGAGAPPVGAAAHGTVGAAAWTGVRYDPARARHGHVESWFLKANDPRGRRALWLKWTIWAAERDPRRAIAEVWAIAFGTARGHVATKAVVPFEQARFERDALGASIDGCTLTASSARGRVASGGRAIGYDLTIASLEAPLVHFPATWMYEHGGFPKQKIVSPVPNGRISGTLDVQGETWTLDAWPGMVGHNWGRVHSESYAWGHCNAWDDGDDVVVEGFSARVRAGVVLLPPVTAIAVRHHGTSYPLFGFASLARNAGTISPRRWRFRARGDRIAVDGEMWADSDDFVGLFYPNPDGTTCYCLNSKLAHAEVTLRIAGRAPKTLRSEHAALELATRDPHHGVRMYV